MSRGVCTHFRSCYRKRKNIISSRKHCGEGREHESSKTATVNPKRRQAVLLDAMLIQAIKSTVLGNHNHRVQAATLGYQQIVDQASSIVQAL